MNGNKQHPALKWSEEKCFTAARLAIGHLLRHVEEQTPIAFVDAQSAAKEARTAPVWDATAGNSTLRFSDEDGAHEVWLLDVAAQSKELGVAGGGLDDEFRAL